MKKQKKSASGLAVALALITASTTSNVYAVTTTTPSTPVVNATASGELPTGDTGNKGELKVTAPTTLYSLDLAQSLSKGEYKWEFVENENNDYYKLSNVVYVKNANFYEWTTSDARGSKENKATVQSMNIFVPAGYVEKIDDNGKLVFNSTAINGYTVETAPIIFENNNAGYLTGLSSDISGGFSDNTVYMSNGFIYVNAGSRGRDIAPSPASVVDLKAAIRYLRANDSVLPGSLNKIISVGTSGGGAISSLIGATGNMDEYYSYLYEIGAAGITKQGENYTSTIKDDVYAAQLYCPISDIENADLAYAWTRFDSSVNGTGNNVYNFTAYQKTLEKELAEDFVSYLNSLELKDKDGNDLTLTSVREGTYYDAVLNEISKAFLAFIADEGWKTIKVSQGMGQPSTTPYANLSIDEWLEKMYGDTSKWLEKTEDGGYKITDMAAFLEGTSLKRNKDIPGFDDLNQSKEGNAFGTGANDVVHFSTSVYKTLLENDKELSKLDGYDAKYLPAYKEATDEAIMDKVYLYSTMQILADEEQSSDVAKFWRMRNGTADQHTSFSVNYNIALTLLKYVPDVNVDYALVWNMGHGANEGTTRGTFVDWVNEISK